MQKKIALVSFVWVLQIQNFEKGGNTAHSHNRTVYCSSSRGKVKFAFHLVSLLVIEADEEAYHTVVSLSIVPM